MKDEAFAKNHSFRIFFNNYHFYEASYPFKLLINLLTFPKDPAQKFTIISSLTPYLSNFSYI